MTAVADNLRLDRVTVLGANGAMGAGTATMFASVGVKVRLVSRDLAKSQGALNAAQGIAKSEALADDMEAMTYDQLAASVDGAELIFECLAEDLALKKDLFAKVDMVRPADSLIATVSSGLSIREMCEGRSDSFKRHFAGIHLYNPPHVMTGVEVIPHPDMPAETVAQLAEALTERFGRAVVVCQDMPAFAGNRIGFKVLNEVAQLAEKHGVQLMDTLVGPYTGRAMAPLATIDLVGWDVHKAIVDNVAGNVQDESIASFAMPAYMNRLLTAGHMGDKTSLKGGFYRKSTKDGKAVTEALDPASGNYIAQDPALKIDFVNEIRDLYHRGRYDQGMDAFMAAEGAQADIARRVILGYVSYALNRVGPGEVVREYADVDRIMTAGFNWAPPSGLVDLMGLDQTIAMLERYNLSVPALLTAAKKGEIPTPLFNLPSITVGRYLSG